MATPVKRPTGRDEILDAVLDAAKRLFALHGPANVSLRAIAEEAGVNYGLLHRRFGTKETLLDVLMQRYADRWLAEVEAHHDFDSAIDRLFGEGAEASENLQLLAWTLVSDRDGRHAEIYRRHAALDALPGLLEQRGVDANEATLDTAVTVAFVFGWRFFSPYIRAALHIDGSAMTDAELHSAVRDRMQRLTQKGEPPR